MSDVSIRTSGKAGRITLTRPDALNALSYDMCRAVDRALRTWKDDPEIALVVMDAEGERAFCAGGDVTQLYTHGIAGDFDYARAFWRDEYRMNARIARYPKPVVTLMQGFTMGGGVGLGCHASHRVVCASTRIAMPECSIGLVPDVGGTWLLGRAPGRCGEYLGTTGTRMDPADALYAGFADVFVAQELWPDLIATLEATGDAGAVAQAARAPEGGTLAKAQDRIDAIFAAGTLTDIHARLVDATDAFATATAESLSRNAPLSMAAALELVRRARQGSGVEDALAQEFRFTFRSVEHGDVLEGIRAQIIDRDRSPRWRDPAGSAPYPSPMLAPLGARALDLTGDET